MSTVLEKTLGKTMTADEFFESPYSRGFELVNGKIISKGGEIETYMPTGALHGAVTEELASRMSYFVRENRPGGGNKISLDSLSETKNGPSSSSE